MSTKMVSLVIGDHYTNLIAEEIKKGNFQNRSEFIRNAIRNWFEKNHKKTNEESK